jgi:hypothetical protein
VGIQNDLMNEFSLFFLLIYHEEILNNHKKVDRLILIFDKEQLNEKCNLFHGTVFRFFYVICLPFLASQTSASAANAASAGHAGACAHNSCTRSASAHSTHARSAPAPSRCGSHVPYYRPRP